MEEPQQLKSFELRKRKRRNRFSHAPYYPSSDDGDDVIKRTDAVELQDVQTISTFSSRSIIYYCLLSLKVGLWLVFAWILSHLHLGAPCFLLPVILWLYSGPMHRALIWAKGRLHCTVSDLIAT